jgi:hypothetical protein
VAVVAEASVTTATNRSVFTPGAFFDADAAGGKGLWYLWYGAVADGRRPTRESIGVATSPSPFGPWSRSPHNPVFDGNHTAWCGAKESARVDHANAYVINGRKLIVVKGVCQNFTALPSVWVSGSASASFEPPYTTLAGAAPMVAALETPEHKGFEHAMLFPGPDGLLHMTGHDHGGGKVPHYVSNGGGVLASDWREMAPVPSFGLSAHEPTTAFAGIPGDQGGVPTHFIQFAPLRGKLAIHLLAVTWAHSTSWTLAQ